MSKRINLSVPAINKRVAKLKYSGTITRFSIITDPKRVGRPITAFILISLNSYTGAAELIRMVKTDPSFLELYAVTGEYDYIAKVYTSSVQELEEKIVRLKNTKCVLKSHTLMGLDEHKYTSAVLP